MSLISESLYPFVLGDERHEEEDASLNNLLPGL